MAMKTILLLVHLLLALPAWAGWEELCENEESVHYVDWTTLKADGQRRSVWGLIDMKTPVAGRGNSKRSLDEYDCKAARWRYLQSTDFSGQMAGGNILINSSAPTPWQYVAPGTFGAMVLETACTPKRPVATPTKR